MDLAKLIEAGEKFGLSGEDLKQFVKGEQSRQREERAELLQLKKHERDTAELQLEIEREKRASIDLNESATQNAKFKAKSPKLPPFHEDKENIDAYLQRFERYAENQNWPTSDWALNLSMLLTGKALDVHARLSRDEANDYKALKNALLKTFQLLTSVTS